jgi:ATP-dependent Zn protease
VALLYAYRSQTPSVPEVDITQAVQDLNSGRIRATTIVANKATLEFADSATHKEQTTVPEPDTILAPAIAGYNATHPAQPIELRHAQDGQTFATVGAILLSLLPVLLIGGFFYYLMGIRRRT